MGILRLGKPNSKIVEEIKRRHEQPVTVKKLKMTGTNGTVCEFDYSNVPQPLTYTNYSRTTNKPYSLCADISSFNTVATVVDEGNEISSIGNQAFYCCTNLSSIYTKNVESIGNNAFSRASISSCNFPKVKIIGEGAFTHCYNISAVNIPEVEIIGVNAFYWDSGLQTVYCPYAVELCSNAFKFTNQLSTIVLSCMSRDRLTTLGSIDIFQGSRKTPVSVYVPLSCIDDLLLNETWSGLVELKTIKLIGV